MEYNKEVVDLTSAELMLLEIIAERSGISGYEINRLVLERGYREWADIGQTSIYLNLRKLKGKELLTSFLDREKTGRGPLPERFSLTERGLLAVQGNILRGLARERERSRRFDLALAGMDLVEPAEVVSALKSRLKLLREVPRRLRRKEEFQGGARLPLSARLLFEHSCMQLEQEARFCEKIIRLIEEGTAAWTEIFS